METISQKVYTMAGKDAGTVELPSSIWGLPKNNDLVHQVVVAMQSNARTGLANVKGRGEVSGGGKKPWQQKGTGRARHGSSRSPIWRHGGVTHGPTVDKNYDRKINRKMKAKALFTVLSEKLRAGKIIFVDSLAMSAIKTKEANNTLTSFAKISGFETINTMKKNNLFIVLASKDEKVAKSFRNIFHVTLEEARNMNPVDLLNYRYLVIESPKKVNEILSAKIDDTRKLAKKANDEKKAVKASTKKVAVKKTRVAKTTSAKTAK